MARDPGEVELERGERAADVVVDLARDRRALVLDARLQVLGELVQALLRGDQVAIGPDAGPDALFLETPAKLRGEELRALLALIVLAVAAKLVFDLTVRPDNLFSLGTPES